jgi:Tol biopolymer transport system component
MTLVSGARVGPYEILALLGSGGMGEVYRARDSRLGRTVAIKVLPKELSSDRERLARFEREARSASALNHPNIVTVYDIGESEAGPYIAMELVEGTTVRELLVPGPLPVKKILSVGAQAADGLAKAHDAGIVHRDLKPENLMVSKDGFVKILDFGLAKLGAPALEELSKMPTVTREAPRTSAGTVLGTVGYMSPEQASGKPVDLRSDQFSFGSILYEMAIGRRAFARGTAAETLAAIIREEPEPAGSADPPLPTPLRWVIERCHAKDPEERYASTRDLARDLAHLRDHVSEASFAATAVAGRPRRRGSALAWAVALLALALAGFLFIRRPSPVAEAAPIRFSVGLPPGVSFESGEIGINSVLSPDGLRLLIRGISDGKERLFLRSLNSLEARPLAGTEGAGSAFWSPDGRFIAFFAAGNLMRIPIAGGPPQTICEARAEGAGSWNREGTILFAEVAGISRVSDQGGQPELILPAQREPRAFNFWPHFLPDGRHFLYVKVSGGGGAERELRIGSLDSKETRSLSEIGSRVEYVPPGYLFHVRAGALLAQPFDAHRLRLAGEAQPIVGEVHYFNGPANAGFSVSQTGAIAYEAGLQSFRVTWFDRTGREVGTLGALLGVDSLRISPNGQRLALDIGDPKSGTSDIWIYDIARNVPTRATFEAPDEVQPVWSADGQRLIFRSDRNGPPDIYEMTPGSSSSEKLVLALPAVEQPEDTSPDSRFLAFSQDSRTTGLDIWMLPLTGDRKPVPFLRTPFDEHSPRFSPDGRWIAYVSTESGEPEVYVTSSDGGSGKVRISVSGGRLPRWRRDGKELFYVAPGSQLMSVPILSASPLRADSPATLFRAESGIGTYDVTPDAQRFIVKESRPGVEASPITVILNWPALLQK